MNADQCKTCHQLRRRSGCGDNWCATKSNVNERFYRALDNLEKSGCKEAARAARKIRGLDW